MSDSGELHDATRGNVLELPEAPGFVSRPPQISPEAMLQRIAETMPWRSTRPGERERRRDQGIAVEFIL